MSNDPSGQPSLNLFLLTQRIGARMIPPATSREEGLGLRAPLRAWRQTLRAAAREQAPTRAIQAYQLEQLYMELARDGREVGPAALLWDKELASRFFPLVAARYGVVSRRDAISSLLDADLRRTRRQPDRARPLSSGWGRLPRRTPGCEPAVEWALSRIRYTAGVQFADIMDLVCDSHLGESYRLLARAMAPQWVRTLPDPQDAALLFKRAFDLQRQRRPLRIRSLGQEPSRVQEQLGASLETMLDYVPDTVPSGLGLVQLSDGDRCLFICCARDMKTTIAEIVQGTAIYLLAKDFWDVNLASLRVGALPVSQVASVSSNVQGAPSRHRLRALQWIATRMIAASQPTFNWPVTHLGN